MAIGARDGEIPWSGGFSLVLSGLGLLGLGLYAGAAITRASDQRARQSTQAGQRPQPPGWGDGRPSAWPARSLQSMQERQAGGTLDDDDYDYLNEPTPHTM